MFGYVKVFKPELKVAELDTYKGIYCSLCKSLGKNYGHLLRMTLSYDYTFLLVLALSVKNNHCEFKKEHCVYNPFKKCYYNTNYTEVYDAVSAIAVMMLYFKVCDNVRDERGFKRFGCRLAKGLLGRKLKKARRLYPELYGIISDLDRLQTEAEASENVGIDVAAEPTAVTLGRICRYLAPCTCEDAFYRIGYCVGKWVYLADAVEDLDDDLARGRFNPLDKDNVSDAAGIMNICSNEAGAAFDSIDAKRYQGIIRNILYLSLPIKAENLVKEREADKQ